MRRRALCHLALYRLGRHLEAAQCRRTVLCRRQQHILLHCKVAEATSEGVDVLRMRVQRRLHRPDLHTLEPLVTDGCVQLFAAAATQVAWSTCSAAAPPAWYRALSIVSARRLKSVLATKRHML